MAVDYRADVELGRPRRVTVGFAVGTAFSGPARKADGAVHEGKVVNYRETNECPPKSPVDPGKPECTKLRGTLEASIAPTPGELDDVELNPLVHSMSVALARTSGGNQELECLAILDEMKPRVGPHVITTMELVQGRLVVPLGVTNAAFARLRPGKAIRRLIRLNGACDAVLISSGPAEGSGPAVGRSVAKSDCTLNGKIYVSVRRVS